MISITTGGRDWCWQSANCDIAGAAIIVSVLSLLILAYAIYQGRKHD